MAVDSVKPLIPSHPSFDLTPSNPGLRISAPRSNRLNRPAALLLQEKIFTCRARFFRYFSATSGVSPLPRRRLHHGNGPSCSRPTVVNTAAFAVPLIPTGQMGVPRGDPLETSDGSTGRNMVRSPFETLSISAHSRTKDHRAIRAWPGRAIF